jgi:transposase
MAQTPTIDRRQASGAALAKSKAKAFRQIAGDTYLVPSATASAGGYVVDHAANTCTCPDFEDRGSACKHVWALRFFRHEIEFAAEPSPSANDGGRPTYPQKWPEYNRAQCEEKARVQVLLRGLCDGIVSPVHERGRPRLPLGDAVFAAIMKVYTTMSGRRATTDIRDCEARGFLRHAPCYNSIYSIIDRADLMPLFQLLVVESAKPLKQIEKSFAADATGFSTNTYTRWFDEKYGHEKKAHRFVKLHAMVGTATHVITAAEVTEANVGDSPMFAPLVDRTAANGFAMKDVTADKAYLSHDNLATVEKVGATPYIPFKSNSGSGGSAAWERMHHLFALNKEDFLAHYHKRSNAESVFSAIKRKFGASVRSKLPVAQLNEVLLKCLCNNVSMLVHAIHELGIEPKFWMPKDGDAP